MAVLTSILDLFDNAIVGMAEQFVRGHASFPTFAAMMTDRFGENYQVPAEQERGFLASVMQASRPADVINSGGLPDASIVPEWQNPSMQSGFLHSGLAHVEVLNSEGDTLYASRILTQLEDQEIITLEEAQRRIVGAIDSVDADTQNQYEGDFDRIEDLIRYHKALGAEYRATVEMYSVFKGQ